MERELWKVLYVVATKLDKPWGRWKYSTADIVVVYLWAVVHDRPMSWAVVKAHWPDDLRPICLPSQSQLSRRMRKDNVWQLMMEVEHTWLGLVAVCSMWVRMIDGKPLGYQLLVEQPNRAFLRHNKLEADGNLYKCNWMGQDVVSTHEKKTHIHGGHADLRDLHKQLTSTQGDEQWEVIQKHIDVRQVATFYAVHMLVSDWDGFFNNHFLYHDVSKTKKWTMYPWDQDKTWGSHDGVGGYDVFVDMPITTGMTGDRPPGWLRASRTGQGPTCAGFGRLFYVGGDQYGTQHRAESTGAERLYGRPCRDPVPAGRLPGGAVATRRLFPLRRA